MRTLDETTRALAAETHGVLARSALLAHGWARTEIDERLRRGEWRPLLHGVLLVDPEAQLGGWAELPFEVRLHAARAYHGPEATFVHESAARLLKIEGLAPDDGRIRVRLPPAANGTSFRGSRCTRSSSGPTRAPPSMDGRSPPRAGR